MIRKKMSNLAVCASAFSLAWAGAAQSAVIFTADLGASDASLPVQAAGADLLDGLTPTSSMGTSAPVSELTDGTPATNVGSTYTGRVFGITNGPNWVITFDALGGIDVAELQVFSANSDTRSFQNYDVTLTRGDTSTVTLTDVISNNFVSTGPYRVTRVSDDASSTLASDVVKIEFTFKPIHVAGLQTALYEIKAIAVPEPASLALAGLGSLLMVMRRQPASR